MGRKNWLWRGREIRKGKHEESRKKGERGNRRGRGAGKKTRKKKRTKSHGQTGGGWAL